MKKLTAGAGLVVLGLSLALASAGCSSKASGSVAASGKSRVAAATTVTAAQSGALSPSNLSAIDQQISQASNLLNQATQDMNNTGGDS